jgi:hypothetical protein
MRGDDHALAALRTPDVLAEAVFHISDARRDHNLNIATCGYMFNMDDDLDDDRLDRPPRRGGYLILSVVSLLMLALTWQVSKRLGWDRDRSLWVGFGGFLAVMTTLRPWWFWENWRARWLRGLIGDPMTMMVYFAVAAVMVWVGLNTNWTFGR